MWGNLQSDIRHLYVERAQEYSRSRHMISILGIFEA